MKSKRRNIYLISPYVFSLAVILIVLGFLITGVVVGKCIEPMKGMELAEIAASSKISGLYVLVALFLILLGILFANSYEYFGTVEILSDRVIFRAPFHRSRSLLYEDLKDVGIDYGIVSPGYRQFWIYLSKETIPHKYFHNILRLPYSPGTMRIQYRADLYRVLLDRMPYQGCGKMLCRSHSVITLFRAESDE